MGVAPAKPDTTTFLSQNYIDNTKYKNAFLLMIGTQEFKCDKFNELAYVKTMQEILKEETDYMKSVYGHLLFQSFDFENMVNKKNDTEDIRKALTSLATKDIGNEDIVIITIISHGEIKNNNYYLICSDTDFDKLEETSLSGEEIRKYIEVIADKGALVLVFFDTCHATAAFDKSSYDGNGTILYFASSSRDEESLEIEQDASFTGGLLDILTQRSPNYNEYSKVTPKTIFNQISTDIGSRTGRHKQTPSQKFHSSIPKSMIEDMPIMDKIETPPPYPSFWGDSKALSPVGISPKKGKNLDSFLIFTEVTSAVGIITCGLIQETSKNNFIKDSNDPLQIKRNNDYRRTAHGASVGCIISGGLLVGSYLIRSLHVHNNLKAEYNRKHNIVRAAVNPIITNDMNGLYLSLNF